MFDIFMRIAAKNVVKMTALVLALLLGTLHAQAAPKTHSPTTSSALSSLLNTKSGPAGALELGDTIVLQTNTIYTGTFILPKVDVGTGWITIQSSAMGLLPPNGVRIKPNDAPNMPKIRPVNGSQTPAIKTAAFAHHFKLIGLEIIAPSTADRNALLVYKLVFSGSSVTISMWVNPVMSEGSLGLAHASLTKIHSSNISSMRISTGSTAVNYQFDEFRLGASFAAIAPTQ